MNQSAQLFSRARAVIPGGVNSPVRAFRNVDGDPFFVQSAKGAYITDADGRQLIDYIAPGARPSGPCSADRSKCRPCRRGQGAGLRHPRGAAEVDMAEMITGHGALRGKSAHGQLRNGSDHVRHQAGARLHQDAAKSSNSSAATTAMWTPCWWRRAPGRSPSENRTAQAYPGK